MSRRHALVERDEQGTADIEAVRQRLFTPEQLHAIQQAEEQLTAGQIDEFLKPLQRAIAQKQTDVATGVRSFFHRHLPKVVDEKSEDMSEREKIVQDLKNCLSSSEKDPIKKYNQAIRLIVKAINEKLDCQGRFVYQLQILRDALKRANSANVSTELAAAAEPATSC